jgi:hypothetical protein
MTPTLERLHNERKARLARMRAAAWQPPTPEPEPEPEPWPEPRENPHYRPLPKRVMTRITEAMAKIDGCPPLDVVMGRGRKAHLILWRWTLVHAIRHHSDRSYTQIGKHIDRDHTTIVHALQKAETAIAEGKSRVVMSDGFEFHVLAKEDENDEQRD